MNRRYFKTLSLIGIAFFLYLGNFAVNVLSDDVKKKAAATFGVGSVGEERAAYLWWGVIAICCAGAMYFFIREHNAAETRTPTNSSINLLFSPDDHENRRRMLKKVRAAWITGILRRSLWNEVVITLGLALKPDAVVGVCDLAQRRIGQADELLPKGTTIGTVYEKQNSELLILGEPGAGKTTQLLMLTEELLNEAEKNEQHPIPVVLNLSTWNARHIGDKSMGSLFAAWLVERLNREYEVPLPLAERWVEAGALLLLLDGLDEVSELRQSDCVAEINAYRRNHGGLRPMVVCCRSREYDAIRNLHLNGAVVIQPLNREQVNSFLRYGGRPLAGLRQVLRDEPFLYEELFNTPLPLHVAAITYANKSAQALKQTTTSKERHRHLWNAYIDEMFRRKEEPGKPRYFKKQTLKWLSWLAYYLLLQKGFPAKKNTDAQIIPRMADEPASVGRTVYFIEEMQIDLLPSAWQRTLCVWLPTLFYILVIWDYSVYCFSEFRFTNIILMLVSAIVVIPYHSSIINVRSVYLFTLKQVNRSQIITSILPATISLIVGNIGFAIVQGIYEPDYLSSTGFGVFNLVILLSCLVGFFTDRVVVEEQSKPNLGVVYMLRQSGIAAAVFVVLGFIPNVAEIVFGLHKWSLTPSEVTVKILSFAAMGMAFFDGSTVLRHYFLRLFLWSSGTFPRNITDFLDYCGDRVLVQRVGGGWQFIHRSLQEHLAEQYHSDTAATQPF